MTKRPPKAQVEAAIRAADGNLTSAASILGCSRAALYTWVYQYGLDRLAGVVPLEAVRSSTKNGGDIPRAVTVKLPTDLHRWLRVQAIDTDRTVGAIVVEALGLLRAIVERRP